MPTDLELLLAEMQTDECASVAFRIDQALEFAQDHLMDAMTGAGSGAVDAATERITDAIELLEGYRARLEDLRVGLASIEAELADMEEGGSAAKVVVEAVPETVAGARSAWQCGPDTTGHL